MEAAGFYSPYSSTRRCPPRSLPGTSGARSGFRPDVKVQASGNGMDGTSGAARLSAAQVTAPGCVGVGEKVRGSFCDLATYRFDGCRSEVLAGPPDDWDDRAAIDWLGRLATGGRFDPDCERPVTLAGTVDATCARA